MKNILWENIIKNIIIIFILIPIYSSIETFFFASDIVLDKSIVGSLLASVSIIVVTACFGNFAFTYEKMKRDSFGLRLLAHITTGLLMFVIGLSLEMTSVLAKLLIGKFYVLDISLLILYVASVFYDFWDLKKIEL